MKLGLMTKSESFTFVELNISGSKQSFNKCDDDSLYLDAKIFNIFVGCFERSNHLFDIIGQTQYDIRKLIPLKNELKLNLERLNLIETFEEFKVYVSSIFLGRDLLNELSKADPMWEQYWKFYLRRLSIINVDLIALVKRCIEEERTLWFIGY